LTVGSLKITTLADNLVQLSGLRGQWGLSFLLELVDAGGRERRVLFDTGNERGPLLHNIKELKAELGDLDCVVISHGHDDHTAATVEMVRGAGGVKVYAHPHTFLPRLYEDRRGKRVRGGVPEGQGTSEIEAAGGEVVLSEGPVEVVPGLWTTGQIPRVTPFETVPPSTRKGRRLIVVEGDEVEDKILDDQALWTEVEGVGPVVLTGCAHAGPVNTLLHARRLGGFGEVWGLAGGTHLAGREGGYIEETVRWLRGFGLMMISPCHCTGFKAAARLWDAFPDEFVLNFCGRVIEAGRMPENRVL